MSGWKHRLTRGIVVTCLVSLLAAVATTGADATQAASKPGAVTHAKASATALHLVLSEPGALPIEPILDASIGATRGALDQSTNEATAFAASGYPGDVLVNPLSLAALGFSPEHIITRITKALPIVVTGWPITAWTVKAEAEHPAKPTEKKEIVNSSRNLPIVLAVRNSSQEASANETAAVATTSLDATIGSPLSAFPQYGWIGELAERYLAPYLDGFVVDLNGSFIEVRGLTSSTHILDSGSTTEVTTETAFSRIDLLGGLLTIGPTSAAISQSGDLKGVKVTRHEVALGPITIMGVGVSVSGGALRVTDQRVPGGHRETVRALLSQIMASTGVRVVTPTKSAQGSTALASALEVTIPLRHSKLVIVPPGTATLTLGIGQVSSDLSLTPEEEEQPSPTPGSGGPSEPVDASLVAHRLERAYTTMVVFAVLAVAFAARRWRRRADLERALGLTRIAA